jgi:hypothetical protein
MILIVKYFIYGNTKYKHCGCIKCTVQLVTLMAATHYIDEYVFWVKLRVEVVYSVFLFQSKVLYIRCLVLYQ